MTPTPAQTEAGNYKKGHTRVHGMDVSIENRKGSIRRGKGKDGRPWQVKMPAHYGYIRRTEGADGDHVDVYLGPQRESQKIFVVNQQDPETKRFDEHKAMVGFPSRQAAMSTYCRGFSDGSGPRRCAGMREMTVDRFKTWLQRGDQSQPLRRQTGGATPAPTPKLPAPGAPPTPGASTPAPTGEIDIDAVKRNIRRMIEQGANEELVNTYVTGLGLTAEELRKPRTMGERWRNTPLGGLIETGKKAFKGKQDPEFADLSIFTGEGLDWGPTGAGLPTLAGTVTYGDKEYGEVIKKQLGNRLVSSKTDKEGYEIITYKGDDGEERTTYINKPGLDIQDVNRGLAAAVPVIATGAGAGTGLRAVGSGVVGRMLGVGTTEGVTSIGQDVAAGTLGSEQGVDWLRAAIAGGGGALFEGLSGPVSRAWRTLFAKNPVDPTTGRLTGSAEAAAKAAGLDPDDMNERLAEEFAKSHLRAADPEEVGGKFRTGEFGIEATKGQRSKDPALLGLEEEARRGLLGREAQEIMRTFDQRQRAAVERAAVEDVGRGRLAPEAPGTEPATTGSRIQTGVEKSRKQFEGVEKKLWQETGDMYPGEGAFDTLGTKIGETVRSRNARPDPELTPSAHRMMQELEDWSQGRPMTSPYSLLGEAEGEARITIDDMRRRLLGLYQGAEQGSNDARTAKALYDGFNNWIEDIAEREAIDGSADAASKLWVARAFTKEMKDLFEPTRAGRTTPTARVLDTIKDADSPEEVVNTILGRAAPTSPAPRGSVQTLTHLKKILGDAGKENWDDIRLAYWVKLAQDNKGHVLSPQRLINNIDGAFANQSSVLKTLYTPQELAVMQRLKRALQDTTYVPPNPSGTSYELKRMREGDILGRSAKLYAGTESKRQLFSQHNILLSRIYQLIAKNLPVSIFQSAERAGAGVARRVTSPKLTPRGASPALGPAATAGALETMEE